MNNSAQINNSHHYIVDCINTAQSPNIKIFMLTANQDQTLVSCDKQLCHIFNQTIQVDDNGKISGAFHMRELFDVDFTVLNGLLQKHAKRRCSLMCFKNSTINGKSYLFIFYIHCKQIDDQYCFRIINCLDWTHSVFGSLEYQYELMRYLNHKKLNGKLATTSDIHSFTLLLPLILAKSRKLPALGLTGVYDILHPYVNRRSKHIDKDYLRNTLSRLHTSLRQHTGKSYANVLDVVVNNETVPDLLINGQRSIANTATVGDLFFYGVKDYFLERIIRAH